MIQIADKKWLNADRIIGMIMLMKGEPDPRCPQDLKPILIEDERILAIDYAFLDSTMTIYVTGPWIGSVLTQVKEARSD
jgi:hypothetical protein